MEPVPGCSGLGDSGKHYCWDPNAHTEPTVAEGALVQVGSTWNPSVKLEACQGDCDNVSFELHLHKMCLFSISSL